MRPRKVGIVVGGGPAPGINAVIGAATIEAINQGLEVVGFLDGFRWLTSEKFDPAKHAMKLEINQVARIHFEGGAILRTSRTSLLDEKTLSEKVRVAPDPKKVGRVLENLRKLGVDGLITIGGDDTALSARFVSEASNGAIRVVHVPKTIDNDLPLPADVPTFGFSTARYIGTLLTKNLMRDSQTTGRWYLVQAMGRTAGWLAMSIGVSAGATVTLIPEEFPAHTRLSLIVDVLEGSMIKRQVMGRPDGVALIAEGLAYRLGDAEELSRLLGYQVPLDAAGHPRLSEVDLAAILKRELERRFKERGQKITIVAQEIGYELRSADPTPYDMGYCRMLGYFSTQVLLNGETPQSMISLNNGNLQPIPFSDMIDPETNRTRTRVVNLKSDIYRVSRAYQIRLDRNDLDNVETLTRLTETAGISPADFKQRFEEAVQLFNGRMTQT